MSQEYIFFIKRPSRFSYRLFNFALTAIAITAFICQRESLYHVRYGLSQILSSVKQLNTTVLGGGLEMGANVGTDDKCLPFYAPYTFETELSKSKPDIEELHKQVKDLYNNATVFRSDLFSLYGYRATHSSVTLGNDTIKATFLICRSGLNNLFSAPWRS